mgnify:CR=1 FL=1
MPTDEKTPTLSQEWFTTWEVAPGVICIAEDQHDQEVRSYLIMGAERSLLWDAGMGIADMRREVERFVAVRPETLLMVCSHSHFDHVGDVWRFAEAGVPVYAHPAEADRIARGLSHEQCARWLQEESLLGPLPTGFDPNRYMIRPATVTHLLNEGEMLGLGDRQFTVLHTPGHSPGGLCLWDAAHGLLLSGDTAYAAPLYSYSSDAEPDVYRRSLRRLADLAPQVRTLLPSHDETPTLPELLVAMADAFDRIHDGNAADVLIGRDDAAGRDRVYDLYDFGPFQVRMQVGWGRKG